MFFFLLKSFVRFEASIFLPDGNIIQLQTISISRVYLKSFCGWFSVSKYSDFYNILKCIEYLEYFILKRIKIVANVQTNIKL